jgi:hypothetical protein
MALADAAARAAGAIHRVAEMLERLARVQPSGASAANPEQIADAIKRGQAPEFIDAMRKALR